MREPTAFHTERLAWVDDLLGDDPRALQALVEKATARRCRTADPDRFFPPDGTRFLRGELYVERDRVERLCRGCPVRRECLAGALLRGEAYGSWGGTAQPDYQVIARMWRDRQAEEQRAEGQEAAA
jgi:hypothetical protein